VIIATALVGCWQTSSSEAELAVELAEERTPAASRKRKKPKKGKWRRVREPEALSAEQQSEIEALEALGYVSGSVVRESAETITVYDAEKSYKGLNLYASGHAAEAKLVDMNGQERHSWRTEFHAVWPDHPARPGGPGAHHFRRVKALANGDLLAIFEGKGILRMNRDSKVIWSAANRAHHDMDFLPNGDLVVLTRAASLIPRLNKNKPILEDFLVVLDAKGQEKTRVSILEALENSEYRTLWAREKPPKGDVFHTNTVYVIPEGYAGAHQAFKPGRVLSSSRSLSLIFVVDLDLGQVVWAHRGEFRKQHDPRLVSGPGLLLFDNMGTKNVSRVIEFDLSTMQPGWTYAGSPEHGFLSRTLGTAHRLPNGNTLVTESEGGRAFELTPEKEIVWEFYNPERAGANGQFIAALFEMTRLPSNFGAGWLDEPEDIDP